MHLTGNTIFITGGGSGIGRGLAEALHGLGNTVIISGRRKAHLDAVTTANPGMGSIELDITDPDSIRAAASKVKSDYPRLNVLFNNAGVMLNDNAAGAIDEGLLKQTIETNLMGPIRITSAFIDHLKDQEQSTILYTTSVLAYVPLAFTAVYSATKAALHSYILSQRFLLRDSSVRVQEIAPPWVKTDLMDFGDDPRAMPLGDFVTQAIDALATDAPEVLVEAAKGIRNRVGPNEHAFVDEFNTWMASAPSH